MVKEKKKTDYSHSEELEGQKELILFNDDFNTFDFVIETLIEVCKHEPEQAEQCTMIIHYKGKCPVKQGVYDNLKPLCDELNNRGLTASIN
ncbi:MAG: ATP-dependent Clp protease adaptor ClpS [Bacteroidales bacterium]|nr:ATP-dependent Clp protease adaptor ClpS [Bacteroidales bacterium]